MKDCFDRGITIATAFYTKWSQTEDWQDCIYSTTDEKCTIYQVSYGVCTMAVRREG